MRPPYTMGCLRRNVALRPPRSLPLRAAALLLSLWASADALAAQPPPLEPLATLGVWADRVWLALLDREGSWYGRLSDEGILQRFNPAQDDEYELDLRTGLFTPSEDARWATGAGALRAAAASIDHPHIAQLAEWRDAFAVAGAWQLRASYVRERTLSARRDHLRPGVFWAPPGDVWRAGATLGLHFFKPAADVELLSSRRWAAGGRGAELALRVAFVDAFNNVVFNGLGVRAEDADAHFDYRAVPIALRADAGGWAGPVRVELRAGLSRRSDARVTFPATGDAPYDLSERVAFAGALIEWHAAPGTGLAVHWSFADAETERRADAPSASDLRLDETTRSAGLRGRQLLGGSWSLEADLSWTERPEVREAGWRLPAGGAPGGVATESVAAPDREWLFGGTLLRRATVGWTGRAFYALMDRRAARLAAQLSGRNQRLVTEGGYRFASGFEVTAGLRWDVDNRGGVPFDGAQLRFTTGPPP